MNMRNFQSNFSRLDRGQKIVGIGSLFLVASVFLPWYEDLDAYNIGDRFLGITGPTSLIGLLILVLSGVILLTFVLRLTNRRALRLPLKEHVFNIFVGAQSFFLLMIVNSIFFHSKFGVNITLKESKFGMILAFVGCLFITFGGYLQMREQKSLGTEGRLEPLIDLSDIEKFHEEHRTVKEDVQRPLDPAKKPEESKGSYTIRMDL